MVLKKLKIGRIYLLTLTDDMSDIGIYRLEDEDKDNYHFLKIIKQEKDKNGEYKPYGEKIEKIAKDEFGYDRRRGKLGKYYIEPADGFYLTNSARKKTMKPKTMKGGKRRRTKKSKTTKRRKTHRRR